MVNTESRIFKIFKSISIEIITKKLGHDNFHLQQQSNCHINAQ